jgi:hypothetical protein
VPAGPAKGLRFEFDAGLPLDFWGGLYESELWSHLRRLCVPGMRAVDVGAHNGYYSLLLARLTGERVIAFESDAAACETVRRNCRANGPLGDLVEVRHAYLAFERNPEVNAWTLDELVDADPSMAPDVLKIDVDRAEASVLHGAGGVLVARRPHLIVETHSAALERECGDLLVGAGYRPLVVGQRRFLSENRPIEHNRWLVAAGAPRSGDGARRS